LVDVARDRQAGSRFRGNNDLNEPLSPSTHGEHSRWRQRRIPMEPILSAEPILIIIVVVLLFGGGGYWGRRHGHW
jgi:hypothetical protein